MNETWEDRERKHALVNQIRAACLAQQQQASVHKGKPRSEAPFLSQSDIYHEIESIRDRAAAQRFGQKGDVQVLVVDRPYPASGQSIVERAPRLQIKDLLLETRHVDNILVVRRFGPVATSPVGGTYGVEDETGTCEFLLVDAFSFAGDQVIPVDAVIAIKAPYCKVDSSGKPRIKLSHPTDLMILPPDHSMIPFKWRMDGPVVSSSTDPSGSSSTNANCCSESLNDISATKVDDMGIAGRGLFAQKAFKFGDKIMTEEATFFLSPNGDCAFRALKYDLSRNMMTEDIGAPYKELANALSQNRDMADKVFRLHSGPVDMPSSGACLIDGKPVTDIFHIHEIWCNNAIACPANLQQKAFPNRVSADSPSASGLWCHAAYCNHSCLPNAEKSFKDRVLTLRATRDIDQGEEITISYGEYIDQAEKLQAMHRIWGFKCECPVCAAESQISKEKLAHREALRTKISAPLPTTLTADLITEATALALEIQTTYPDTSYAPHIPRTAVAEAYCRLVTIHLKLRNFNAAEAALRKMLYALAVLDLVEAIVIPLGGILGERSVANILLLASLQRKTRQDDDDDEVVGVVVKQLEEFAAKVYLVLNGSMEGFEKLVLPLEM